VSEDLHKLQSVCGRLGLNISMSKTIWLYLHYPSTASMGECKTKWTQLAHCCEQILMDGKPIKHVSCFKYLGSIGVKTVVWKKIHAMVSSRLRLA
jgi:hypothetical protein